MTIQSTTRPGLGVSTAQKRHGQWSREWYRRRRCCTFDEIQMVGDVAEDGDGGQHQAPGAPRLVVAPLRLVELASLCSHLYISVCLVPAEPGVCRYQQLAFCGAARQSLSTQTDEGQYTRVMR